MAGLTPAVSSPFGNNGSQLAAPIAAPAAQAGSDPNALVPGGPVGVRLATPEDAAAAGLSVTPSVPGTPDVSASAPTDASASGQPDADLDQFLADLANPPDPNALSNEPAPEGLASLKEQANEAFSRLQYAFTKTGKEAVDAFKQSGVFDDVREQDGIVQVKRKGRKGWEKFDREGMQASDIIDLSRDVLEGAIQGAFVTAGTPGGIPGAMAAGAAGGVAAKSVGDTVAQNVLSIPRDPSRNNAQEYTAAGAIGGLLGPSSKWLAARAATRAAMQNEANRTVEYATKRANEAIDDINTVKQSGIVLGENGKFQLDPQQLVGGGQIPELDAAAKDLSTMESFRNFRRQVGDSVQNAYDTVTKALGAASGKGATLADDFQLTANDVKQAEGKLIGSFRQLADSKLAGTPQPAPQFVSMLQTIHQSAQRDVSDLALALGVSEQQANQVQKLINGLMTRTQTNSGEFTVDEMEQITKQLTNIINANMKSATGRPVGIALIDLKNAIRDDWTDAMGQVLPKSAQTAYAASKEKYRSIINASNSLGKLLATENISKYELISRLFEQKGSYKFAQSAKTLMQETNPRLWSSLSGEFLAKLRADATDAVSGSVNWGQISKKWAAVDPRLQKDVLESTGIPVEGLNALIRLGTRLQGATVESLARPAEERMVKGAIKQFFTWGASAVGLGNAGASAKAGAVSALISGMGKDKALSKWLSNGGLEAVLREMPGLSVPKKTILRSMFQAPYTTGRILGKAVGREAMQQGITSVTRQPEQPPQ